jgi:hypothetical protein
MKLSAIEIRSAFLVPLETGSRCSTSSARVQEIGGLKASSMKVEGGAKRVSSEIDAMTVSDDWTKETKAGIEAGAAHAQAPPAQHGSVWGAGCRLPFGALPE